MRAGIRLGSMLPKGVTPKVNAALADKGINVDVSSLKPESMDKLVEALSELTVDVQDSNGGNVRIFCE